jgi:ATP-binding cassette subfamily F protein 3
LQRFLFDHNLRDKRVKDLSPGQKARLTFAVFAQKEFECLILDEPTNHLDIETKQAIEHALNEYKGTIILVSHDRYFARELNPDRILTIVEGKLEDITYKE